MEPLVAGHCWHISDLRVSGTDRCNFRRQYCTPADGLRRLERPAVHTLGECQPGARLKGRMSIIDSRLTGGAAPRRGGHAELGSQRGRAPGSPSAAAALCRSAAARGGRASTIPRTEPFCADDNRVRTTAEGKLRTCLFSLRETDLREHLRSGASDAELERIIRDAVWRKELKHHVGEPGFRQPPRTMSAIGGWGTTPPGS